MTACRRLKSLLLDTCLVPSHYLNQCWFIIYWTIGNNISERGIKIEQFSFKKTNLTMTSATWWPCCLSPNVLTHLLLVLHRCQLIVSALVQIINWTHGNNLHWNSKQNTKFFIHEKASENIICEMATMLSQTQCVKEPPTACVNTTMRGWRMWPWELGQSLAMFRKKYYFYK